MSISASEFLKWLNVFKVPQGTTPINGKVNAGILNQIAYYAATGSTVSGLTSANNATLTTNSSGVPSWTASALPMGYADITGTTQAASVNMIYTTSNAAQTTATLPATAALGSRVSLQGQGAAGWVLKANTGQVINVYGSPTSSGGTVTSANRYDSIEVICTVANTTWGTRFVSSLPAIA